MAKIALHEKEENTRAKFNDHGQEIPDKRPLQLVINLGKKVESNDERIKRMLNAELNKHAEHKRGTETFIDSTDFEVVDDASVPLSGHEFIEPTVEPTLDDVPSTEPEPVVTEPAPVVDTTTEQPADIAEPAVTE